MEEMKGAMGGEGEEGGWEDGEDGLVKMMDKMMGSLLFSRDVLYPFLSHTCKQVVQWCLYITYIIRLCRRVLKCA